MKTKKALKRLNKIEGLLSGVIDNLPGSQKNLGELLDSAKTAVVRAKKSVTSQLAAEATRARKKEGATASRKGVEAVAKKRTTRAA